MATYSSILVWEIPWTEEPGRLQSMGVPKELDTTSQLNNNKKQHGITSESKQSKYSKSNLLNHLVHHLHFR